jgi:hypothetical protein
MVSESDRNDQIQCRNPWWCGGTVPLSMSKGNEFWSYRWLDNFVSAVVSLIRELCSSLKKKINNSTRIWIMEAKEERR